MAKYKMNPKNVIEIIVAALITWAIFSLLHIFG